MAWGQLWTDIGLVFTQENGIAWHPDRISKLFETAVTASGLPRIRLHDSPPHPRHPGPGRGGASQGRG